MNENLAAELISAIGQLTERIHVLQQAVDDVQQELHWANNNAQRRMGFGPQRRITSVPLDPAARQCSAPVNAVDTDTIKQRRSDVTTASSPSTSQSRLF